MLPELTQDEFSAALDGAAAEALEAVAAVPPIDAFAVAQCLGLRVAFDDRQRGRGRFVSLKSFGGGPGTGSILIRPEPREERLQWAVAHEIGECLASRVFQVLAIDARESPADARETVANLLAGRLLLPVAWFKPAAIDCDWDLFALKRMFSTVSHELIARRMLDFEPPVIVTVFDHGRLTWRRGNLGIRPAALSVVEVRCWRESHERGEPQFDEDRSQAVWAWPVHEAGWKREVLRTMVATGECCDEP